MTMQEKRDYAIDGKECLEGNDWGEEKENMCVALGDCGVKTNYLGQSGFNIWDDLFVYEGEDDD